MNASSDTIVSIATPPGTGGIGIVRLSGPDAAAIAKAMCGELPAPRTAELRGFRNVDGERIDVAATCLRYGHARAEALGKPVRFWIVRNDIGLHDAGRFKKLAIILFE